MRIRTPLFGLLLLSQSNPVFTLDDTVQPLRQGPANAAACALFDSALATCQIDPSLSLQYASRGLEIARALNDSRLLAAGFQLNGEARFQQGDNDSAEIFYSTALKHAQAIGDDSLMAVALNSIGFMYNLRGNYELAFQRCHDALTIAQRAGLRKLVVRAYNSLGLTAGYLGPQHDDMAYFHLAMKEAVAIDDYDGIAITDNHLGNLYGSRNMYDSAMYHYRRALVLRERHESNTNALAILLNNTGNILRSQKNFNGALDYYRRSLAISMKTGSKSLIATTYKNMAILARNTKDYAHALEYATTAKEISSHIFLHRIALQSTEEIARTFYELGEYRSAYASLQDYIHLKDSLENQVTLRRAAELQIRFETARKEHQIQELALAQERTVRDFLVAVIGLALALGVVLFRQYRLKSKVARETARQKSELERLYGELLTNNARLQESETHLRDSLREKEVLFKEVHHRVKNNLQIISSLLNLQSHSINNEQVLGILRESQDRIRSMALIHERLYSSNDFAHIELKGYLGELVDYLRSSYGTYQVNVAVDVEPMAMNLDTAIPLGLIITELVVNALKHGFPDGTSGIVTVGVRSLTEDKCQIVVKDNGKGLPPNFKLGNTSTLGLQLVQILVKQLGGHLVTEEDNGASFSITIPLHHKP